LTLLCGRMANAQNKEAVQVPQPAKAAVSKAYPGARNVKWEKENNLFEATFVSNKKEMSVLVDDRGVIREEETEIVKSELPAVVTASLKKDFAGYKIGETARIVSNNVTTYEAEVDKGGTTFEVIFDNKGNVMKKTIEDEKEKED
jgi:hypothetical protein